MYIGIDIVGGGGNVDTRVYKGGIGATWIRVWVGNSTSIGIYEHQGVLVGSPGATTATWATPSKITKEMMGKMSEAWLENLDTYHCSVKLNSSIIATSGSQNVDVKVELSHGTNAKDQMRIWCPMAMEGAVQAGFTAYGLLKKVTLGAMIGGGDVGDASTLARRVSTFKRYAT